MQNKVLITGASGFLGSHLAKALSGQKILTLKHGLFSPEDVTKVAPDVIYNLAAYGNMSNQKDEWENVNANIIGLWTLLQVTKDIPYKKFVQISTSSVLLNHQTIYSATKLGAEALCKAYTDEYNKPIIVARPYSIYGEGEAEFRFIPTVIRALLYGEMIDLDTQATHDWVHVDDFVEALIGLEVPGFYNLGTGYALSNLEIVRKLEAISGKKLSYTEKKLRSFDTNAWVSPEASVMSDIDEGLSRTFNYYAKKFTSN